MAAELTTTTDDKPEQARLQEMDRELREYKALQTMLDKALPDAIMVIQRQQFRKKKYWRAVAKHFGLSAEVVNEERFELPPGGPYPSWLAWGVSIRVRVTAPNGQFQEANGACAAYEKLVTKKDWKVRPPKVIYKDGRPVVDEVKTADNATYHNIAGHALTRAKNRAIADLVGFGEVSAEEMPFRDWNEANEPPPRDEREPEPPPAKKDTGKANDVFEDEEPDDDQEPITKYQKGVLIELLEEAEVETVTALRRMSNRYGRTIQSIDQLRKPEAAELIDLTRKSLVPKK